MLIIARCPGIGKCFSEFRRKLSAKDSIPCIRRCRWNNTEMIFTFDLEEISDLALHDHPLIETHTVDHEINYILLSFFEYRKNPFFGNIRRKCRTVAGIIAGVYRIDPALVIALEEFSELCIHFALLI